MHGGFALRNAIKRLLPVALIVALSPGGTAQAQMPELLRHQAQLYLGTNPVATPVSLSLRIYDAASGGTLLYEDSNYVGVVRGVYSTVLGDFTKFGTLTNALASTNAHLQIKVYGVDIASPRERMTAVPYAFDARLTQGAAAGGIARTMMASGAVGSVQLAAGAVTPPAILDGTVGAADIASNSVTAVAVEDAAGTSGKVNNVRSLLNLATITNPAPANLDNFGQTIARVGSSRFVVGAPLDDTDSFNGGSAYLYGSTGNFISVIHNPAPEFMDGFGGAVAGVGTNRFVVGCPRDLTDSGSAYLYDFNGSLLATLNNPDPGYDYFGSAVAGVSTDRFVVCARLDDVVAAGGVVTNAGSAYLYDINGNFLTAITNPTPEYFDFFGSSVASVGSDRFVVGAERQVVDGMLGVGCAYLYNKNGILLATITNPSPYVEHVFGHAAAGVGPNFFAVGTPGAGMVYVFNYDGQLLRTLSDPTPIDVPGNDSFGASVCGFGSDLLLVGARESHLEPNNTGTVYLYRLAGKLLATIPNPTRGGWEEFGFALAAIDSNRFVVGSPYDNHGASSAGAAYIFQDTGLFYFDGVIAEGAGPGGVAASMLAPSVDARYLHAQGGTMSNALAAPSIGLASTGTPVQVHSGEYTRRTSPIAHIAAIGTSSIETFNPYNCTLQRLDTGCYRMLFFSPPATAYYVPWITPVSAEPRFATLADATTNGFDFCIYDAAGVAQDGDFSVVVFGGF